MNICITGGDGFIARSINEGLCDRFSIVSVNRRMLDLLDSAKVSAFFKQNRFDAVIHTATYDAAPSFSRKDPAKVLENNLRMFFNLVRCKDDYGKMIYFGSGAEYSKAHWKPKMKETYFDTHVPGDPYGYSKYIMSQYAQSSRNIYNLRLFGVFGKYDDWRYRFIPNACCQALFDLPITIKQNAVYDFLFIDDLVKIVEWFLTHDPLQPAYNVCSGKPYEFKTLAQKISEISGKQLDIHVQQNVPGKEYSGDNSRLLNALDHFKFTPIEQSIAKLFQWYAQHIDIINKAQLFN